MDERCRRIYKRLDDDDGTTDAEKRETYFADIANEEAEEAWREQGH